MATPVLPWCSILSSITLQKWFVLLLLFLAKERVTLFLDRFFRDGANYNRSSGRKKHLKPIWLDNRCFSIPTYIHEYTEYTWCIFECAGSSVPLVYQNFLSKRCWETFGLCWAIFRPELWGHVAPMSVPRSMRWNQLIFAGLTAMHNLIVLDIILYYFQYMIRSLWSSLYSGMGCSHRNGPRCVCVCMYVYLTSAGWEPCTAWNNG